jgi:two-component system chemotaxis response regulator CheY
MATIMIVDDAAFLRAMLKEILIRGGHEVITEAGNGEEAVDKYKLYRPDLVTMDITMPVMEGVEALKQIRKMNPDARVVMCSDVGQRHQILDAIQSGAKDFIVKPFQGSRVLETVNKAISG